MIRFSLRELLVVIAFASMAFASLKFANDFWFASIAAVTMIVLFGSLILATIDRGPRQAFAIGFALTMVAYGLMLMTGERTTGSGGTVYSQNIEFDQWQGHLPTTRLLRYVHMAVDRSEWLDPNGKVIPNYDPQTWANGKFREIPPREILMPIGHCWWALILGYAGGHFARFVYGRRIRETQKRPADVS